MGNPNHPRILQQIMDYPEGRDFRALCKKVNPAEKPPPYELSESERQHALFTNRSCSVVRNHQKWKAALWSPT